MTGGSGGVWRWSSLTLAVLLLTLVATSAVLALGRESGMAELERAATPWQEPGNELTERSRAVAEAARAETLAFLAVDHRDMEPLTDRVLAGATGEFKEQYAARRDTLVRQAERAESISTGEVVALGVSDLTDQSATALVAANSQVRNASTDGAVETRYYRLRLGLEQVEGRWLVSRIEFVG